MFVLDHPNVFAAFGSLLFFDGQKNNGEERLNGIEDFLFLRCFSVMSGLMNVFSYK